jgi:outer membrane protein assembly factor BamB
MLATSLNLAAALLGSLLVGSAAPSTPVGWRDNGTGCYPHAKPPTEWAEGTNVLWKTKLPGRSQGSPILVGKRLFVVSDPAELLCVDADNGAILWRRSNAPEEIYGLQKAKEIAAEYTRRKAARRSLEHDLGQAKGDPDRQKDIRKQLDALTKEYREWSQRFPQPPAYADGETTNSAATPISDGKQVYAVFGNGIVCAYTSGSERRWIKFLETPAIGFGHGSSPALADGKLIVHLNDLFALDAATGETVWRVPLPARHASPLVTKVGQTPVVISPAGAVLRVADGKVLLKNGALSASECSPVLHEDIVYAVPGGARALRLVPAGEDAVKIEKLWEARTGGGRRTPSPVLHDGLLYSVNTDGILEVLDAANGGAVYKQRLDIGSLYSSITSAGNYLYLGGTRGTTIVLAPGREYREVARNKLEGFGSSPVFRGRRMFVRTRQHLYCIGE